jgi:hypothetical protein
MAMHTTNPRKGARAGVRLTGKLVPNPKTNYFRNWEEVALDEDENSFSHATPARQTHSQRPQGEREVGVGGTQANV